MRSDHLSKHAKTHEISNGSTISPSACSSTSTMNLDQTSNELLDTTVQSHSSNGSSDEITGDLSSHDEDEQDEIIDVQYWNLVE